MLQYILGEFSSHFTLVLVLSFALREAITVNSLNQIQRPFSNPSITTVTTVIDDSLVVIH